MNKYFFAALIFCSASARWPGAQESNFETFIRISKAAGIGAAHGFINGEFGKKMYMGEVPFHTITLIGAHGLRYKLNNDKHPTNAELWAHGIAQTIAEHASTVPAGNNSSNYMMHINLTLGFAVLKTGWFLFFREKI